MGVDRTDDLYDNVIKNRVSLFVEMGKAKRF